MIHDIKSSALWAVIALLVAPFLYCEPVAAKDLGIQGTVWGIAEDDLLLHMQARANAWGRNGGLERYQRGMTANTKAYVTAPPTVRGLSKTTKTMSRLFDPAITLNNDLTDDKGVVFARAGTEVNALDYISLSKDLVFVDGSDETQLIWALGKEKAKIILVKGRVVDLQKHYKRRFYFDQQGILTNRFSLTRVPAVITQEGRMLKITEVALGERGEEK